MKVLVYSSKKFELPYLEKANKGGHTVTYTQDALDSNTAIKAVGHEAIAIFSGDDASLLVLEKLRDLGVKYIATRSTGHNNIHVKSAKRLGLKVANAPGYAPHAIAEHAVGLLLALNRKIILANTQVQQYNFLQDKLMGFNLHQKKVGIVGTGNIGAVMAKIMHGFGCSILAHDPIHNPYLANQYDLHYVSMEELCSQSDIISLHVPLVYETHYLINARLLAMMKKKVVLINTARGAVVDTKALIDALENGQIGGYATDVYEKEKGVFFKDHSKGGIKDQQLKKLLSFPNVLLTPHQAFITGEALENIAKTTFYNIDCWELGVKSDNELGFESAM
ncbi:D-lactate dehydrogenase [Arenibacter nanhaiticus]|uniref:D-lactate dehydrogenase n=1 Tax=Arenibacter nanhaiticus TaxID=558155 RepID=A0A1M6JDU0_9FLAO|nr:2-hydroxyacid dehydrogenase [Arenibacter nanhaiticus]SHJ44814.1 D-lactate dehydrogenase [Arenibacter nanhaiticus]